MKELAELSTIDWATIVSLLVPCLVVWLVVIRRLRNGKPAIEPQPRRTVPWGGFDMVVILILYTTICAATGLSLGVALDAQTGLPDPSQLSLAILATSIGSFLAVPVCAGLLVYRWRGTPRDLGLPTSWKEFASDLRLGAAGFAAVTFPVLVLHVVLAALLKDIFPYRHDVYETMFADPSTRTFLVMAFSAIIAAPLWEEFSFRLLLQSWMQKVVQASALVSVSSDESSDHPAQSMPSPGVSWVPVVGSSLAFASTHIGQGPAPIAIFFLGLVLGYIYRQTQRILPCVLLHMLFNTVGIATAWLAIQTGQLPN